MIVALSFLLSFCGISYQFLLARTLGQFTSDEVLSQSMSLGFYLASMGLGAALFAKSRIGREPAFTLVCLETALAVLGGGVVFILYVLHTIIEARYSNFLSGMSLRNISLFQILIFQIPNCAVGALAGFELPLLIQMQKERGEKYQRVIAASYFGALVASFVLYLWILPRFGLIRSAVLISVVNFLVAFFVLLWIRKPMLRLASAIIICVIFFGGTSFMQQRLDLVEQGFVKEHYLEARISDLSWVTLKNLYNYFSSYNPVERYVTPYQIVDIVPDNFKIAGNELKDFTLYLNMQTQFSRSLERPYHETMADGAINLSGTIPKRVLVLGSGDGILAGELLRYKEIESITLVEIDPFMVRLAREHSTLLELNHGSFFDPRVKIHIGDAFQFIRRTNEHFDAVFVDFPFPTSYELGKLFSVEFYQSLHGVLTPNGFFVADIPYWPSYLHDHKPRPYPQDIVLSTLAASKFENVFPYGPFESFVFVRATQDPIHFQYDHVPSWVANISLVNWRPISREQLNAEIRADYVNSIFHPKRFQW